MFFSTFDLLSIQICTSIQHQAGAVSLATVFLLSLSQKKKSSVNFCLVFFFSFFCCLVNVTIIRDDVLFPPVSLKMSVRHSRIVFAIYALIPFNIFVEKLTQITTAFIRAKVLLNPHVFISIVVTSFSPQIKVA